MSGSQLWRFDAFDTLFFRESRPMESLGGSELGGVFPPPVRTMIGALRTAVGDALGVDWNHYRKDPSHPLRSRIGTPDSLGPLHFGAPHLSWEGERLYPIPLSLLSNDKQMTRLVPGSVVECDLGRVALPTMREPMPGAKPMEGAFLTGDSLLAFLSGNDPAPETILPREHQHLFEEESRLGIGRDNARSTVIEGLLYQTRHIRPNPKLSIGMEVTGLDTSGLPPTGMARLGGEGRLAAWSRQDAAHQLQVPQPPTGAKGVLLLLLAPALFEQGWLPDGFAPKATDEQVRWHGRLHEVDLRIVSAVCGKAQREGGWNMADRRSRPVQSLVPAGSCYFCEVDGDLFRAATALHGKAIGNECEYGRGEIAVGYW